MKQLIRKAAEAKSALVSKEAANNSTEVVILILFVVIIVFAVGAAIKNVLVGSDGAGGIVKNASDKVAEKATSLDTNG